MSCSNCNKSNCSCSDNCPTLTSDITTFDGVFNMIEVPCGASLNDVLALLEEFSINITSSVTTFSFLEGNCLGLPEGNYTLQQVLDELIDRICNIPTCPLHALISLNENGTLTVNATGGVGPYTYQWSIADNVVGIEIDGSSTTDTVTIIDGGSPIASSGLVKVVVTDDNGCSVNDVFLYFVPIIT